MCQIEVVFEQQRDLVVFEVTGPVDLPALIAAADRHYSKHRTHRTIWDLRRADGSGLSFHEMRDVYAKKRSRHVPEDSPQSALIVLDESSLGLARLYGVMTETEGTAMRYAAFLSWEEADVWLELAPELAS